MGHEGTGSQKALWDVLRSPRNSGSAGRSSALAPPQAGGRDPALPPHPLHRSLPSCRLWALTPRGSRTPGTHLARRRDRGAPTPRGARTPRPPDRAQRQRGAHTAGLGDTSAHLAGRRDTGAHLVRCGNTGAHPAGRRDRGAPIRRRAGTEGRPPRGARGHRHPSLGVWRPGRPPGGERPQIPALTKGPKEQQGKKD